MIKKITMMTILILIIVNCYTKSKFNLKLDNYKYIIIAANINGHKRFWGIRL